MFPCSFPLLITINMLFLVKNSKNSHDYSRYFIFSILFTQFPPFFFYLLFKQPFNLFQFLGFML